MKKLIIILAIIFCLFQMMVLAIAIDVGVIGEDWDYKVSANNTWANIGNPANATGTITSIQIFLGSASTGDLTVATFFRVDENHFTARDSVNLGAVSAGSNLTFTKDKNNNDIALDIESGDIIGYFSATGSAECDVTGGDDLVYGSGDCTESTNFMVWTNADDRMGLYGTGATGEAKDNALFWFNF